uniref:NADH:ubiquinone oxidoreductase complex assembly factor 8 n=1 Tax=Hucho hucho TaxID=62062 RepID=A0A4W5KP05_9TELE
MSGRNVSTRSQERMRCPSAAVYGKCVTATTTGRQELRKDLCVKEFNALTCFVTAAKKGVK